MDKIGIKLANGEFYPILDAGVPAKKHLTVTTVADGQKSVQIDLYRGEGLSILNSDYMGSLVIESIHEAPAGEPDIKLELELDEEGLLKCRVHSPDTGEIQSLKVSLESLAEEDKYEIPDFDLEEERTDRLPSEATSPEEGAGLLEAAARVREGRERGRSPVFYLALLGGLVVTLLLAWLVYQCALPGGDTSSKPPVALAPTAPSPTQTPAQATPPKTTAAPAAVATPAPSAAATSKPAATATKPAAAPAPATKTPAQTSAPSPAPSGKEQRYRLKWGDTLWDLAFVYYRDPWLYPRIARANKIRNPDRIISGTWIIIPPR